MHFAPDPQRQKASRRRPPRAGASQARSFSCELLEPRWLLTGDYVIETVEPPFDEALVASSLETEPIAYPMAVAASQEATPLAGSATPGGFTPEQMRHAYGFDQIFFDGGTIVGDGAGQTIAIVNAFHTPSAAADLTAFNTHFGLPAAPSFVQVDQNGGTSFPGTDSGWALETALDVQWAHAFAPGADILLVEADSAAFSDLMVAVDYARSQPDVSVVSMSWGTTGEFSTETNFDFHFTTPAAHEGVTFFAAAGNSGGPGGYPAYSPNVVAVGGTTLALDGSNNISSESAWSGSGGGISQFETQPFWQNGVVTQTTTQRAMPDVAFDANPSTGVPVYDTFNNSPSTPWTKVAGTSFATPSWASLVAVANQGRALEGLSSMDMTELMTTLYAMPADSFNDITSGASGGSIPQSAGPGYDLVTGLGSPKAQKIVAGLVGTTSITGTVFDDINGNGAFEAEPGLAGWTVYADLNTNGTFDAATVDNFNSADVPKTISSFGTPTVTSQQTVSGLAGNVIDVDVTLDITHTRTSDLTITLIAPDSTEIVLASQVGGTGDDFDDTVFDDAAATPIASGSAPFSGSFQPAEALATLSGVDPNGTWQLRVADGVFFDGGSLSSWSLEITTGEPSTLSGPDGAYHLDGLADGTYQIRQVLESPYVQTAPAGGFYTVVLAGGGSAADRDFGNQLPAAATVSGRHLFYDNSSFDGAAGIDPGDGAAIAADKTAYLPGDGLITPASMSSYSRGLNGLFVDLTGTHGALSLADFEFKVSEQDTGANNAPSTWAAAPAPSAFTVLSDAPAVGTDRVEFIWADGAIENRYLEVTVKGNDAAGGFNTNTGLSASDVFYFGNLVGDTFLDTPATVFLTSSADEIAIQTQIVSAAGVTSAYDMDRNGVHLSSDRIVARGNTITALNRLDLAAPPPAPSAEPVDVADASGPDNPLSPGGTDNSLSVLRSNTRDSRLAESRPPTLEGLLSLRDPDNKLSEPPTSAVASALVIPDVPSRLPHSHSAPAPRSVIETSLLQLLDESAHTQPAAPLLPAFEVVTPDSPLDDLLDLLAADRLTSEI